MPLDSERVIEAPDAISTRVQREALPLYANRIKVYPKRVTGIFRRIKWALLAACLAVYYITPWLRWDRGPGAPDQAVLIDLPGRRAYFFFIEIWPQEVYFLTGLLILAAIGLFLVTSLLGRVWCGYACPQTVWTDLFMLVERWIEGDRNQRMKLDKQPWSLSKATRKIVKHTVWVVIAILTGGAWVFYFSDAPTALVDIVTLRASMAIYGFVGLFAATTYLLAGWAREQVCTYMCPWPRFQAAMLDENTLTVTYQAWRGEKRGKHKAGQSWEGRGDCVDCGQCIAVCPTGIDIRDGQQLECIGCGLCIDACDGVMAKVGRPARLITFDTLARQTARASGTGAAFRFVRARTMIYAALLSVVAVVMLGAFVMRPGVEVNVLRDRSPLFVTLSDGSIRNGYTLKILNKSRSRRNYTLSVVGLPQARFSVVGIEAGGDILPAAPDSVATYQVFVVVPAESLTGESTPISFNLDDGRERARHGSVFLGPKR